MEINDFVYSETVNGRAYNYFATFAKGARLWSFLDAARKYRRKCVDGIKSIGSRVRIIRAEDRPSLTSAVGSTGTVKQIVARPSRTSYVSERPFWYVIHLDKLYTTVPDGEYRDRDLYLRDEDIEDLPFEDDTVPRRRGRIDVLDDHDVIPNPVRRIR